MPTSTTESTPLAPGDDLTFRQRKFAELVAIEQIPPFRAYAMAGYKHNQTNPYACIKRERVARYVAFLRAKRIEGTTLEREEKRRFLASAIRTPIDQIDENSPLAQEVTRRIERNRDGEEIAEIVKIKSVDKLAALKIDNDMTGDNAPVVVASIGLDDLLAGAVPPAPTVTIEELGAPGAPGETEES